MDELDISGKQYISTRRAGKEHGYHSDYIGQLIRGGKVTGQKVGRAWYVDAQSLAAYLGKAYDTPVQKTAPAEAVEVAKPLDTISSETSAPVQPVVVQLVVEPVAAATVESNVAEPVAIPVAVVEEKKIESVAEVRAVPIQIERVAEPVKPKEEKTVAPSGLVYIADDAPSLPQVQVMHAPSEVSMAQAAVVFVPQKSRIFAASIAFGGVAVVVILLGVGAGAYISSTVQVVGETASVSYAIGK